MMRAHAHRRPSTGCLALTASSPLAPVHLGEGTGVRGTAQHPALIMSFNENTQILSGFRTGDESRSLVTRSPHPQPLSPEYQGEGRLSQVYATRDRLKHELMSALGGESS